MADLIHLDHEIHELDGSADRVIAEIAARQHGVVARWQLRALGVGRGAIDHRLAAGRLHCLYRAVYAVGHTVLTRHGRWMAAALAIGEDALVSHRSAAAIHGIAPSAGGRVHVTTTGHRRGPRGIAVHRVRSLHPDDRTIVDGIPVTSIARTLLDFAEVAREDQVRRAFEEADRRQLLDMRAVDALLERSSGRRGQRVLKAVAAEAVPAEFTRSDLERAFVELCREADLPRPAMNLWIAGFEVDAVWPEQRLVVEVDSYEYHRTRAAFERDRKRDTALQIEGFRVVRVTDQRLISETADVANSIRALL